MGNVTGTIKARGIQGSSRVTVADLKLSNSYATGGDTIPAALISQLLDVEGNPALTDVLRFDAEVAIDGTTLVLDRTNKKILAWNGRTQVPNTTDLSANAVRCTFIVDINAVAA